MSDCGDEFDAADTGPVETDLIEAERLFNAELLRAVELGFVEDDDGG